MSALLRSLVVGLGFACLAGCSSVGAESEAEQTSGIKLDFTTVAQSGNVYRLGPASFDISGDATLTVDTNGDEPLVHVDLQPGQYQVALKPGWALQLLGANGTSTPTAATLLSSPVRSVQVSDFHVTELSYAFHLGASGLDIGISVDEGVPAGYDALIEQLPDGSYSITFASGGGACCFSSVEQARQAYPQLNMFVKAA
ncbi:MAG: hypothetical protein QM756_02635 [Polyangiaceae bacterium]